MLVRVARTATAAQHLQRTRCEIRADKAVYTRRQANVFFGAGAMYGATSRRGAGARELAIALEHCY